MTANEIRQQAAYLSLRAQEMRAAATSALDGECGGILLGIAASYDNQAALLTSRLGPTSAAMR